MYSILYLKTLKKWWMVEYRCSQTSNSACYGSAALSEYSRPEKQQHYLPWCNPPCLTGLPNAKNTPLEKQKKQGSSFLVKQTAEAYTLIWLWISRFHWCQSKRLLLLKRLISYEFSICPGLTELSLNLHNLFKKKSFHVFQSLTSNKLF